ncbi:hypothetical protein MPSEU_000725800 [Mayamaea pseudoterrestris]|nr:hypothetical protein MPSEU_000725800 [Mayamaea pseudoterrestris]
MMNLFRRGEATPKSSQNRKNASDRSSVAVAADKIPSKPSSNHHERHLIPPSSLYHSYHAANEDSGLRSDDWALAAPTGVTDDRSDGSPSRMHTDMESTIASQDSFTVDRANQQQQLHAKDWSSPVHSSKNYTGTGQAKIFTPPHGAKTPRSSNQRYSNRANANESAAAAAPYYFFMKDHQTKRKPHKNSNNDESDGIFWQGPQSWWTVARNRLGGADSTKDDDLLQPSKPKPSKNTGRAPLCITTTSPERNDQTATNDNASSWTQRLGVFVCSSAIVYMILFVGMAAGLTYGTMNQLRFFSNINWDEQITVAFVGTSYLFVNDIPRLLEVMSGGQVIQDSCLRSGGSLATVLLSGNGMYYRWQTNEALIYSNEEQDDYYSTPDDVTSGSNDSRPLYDYGACSVHQLIAGYDNYLEYGNGNRAYSDDGNNPCLVDENYLRFITTNKYSSSSNVPKWDFVVLADQSKRMAASSGSARYDTTDALVSVYAPLLLQSGSVPVIVDTHAFWSSHSNMTGENVSCEACLFMS